MNIQLENQIKLELPTWQIIINQAKKKSLYKQFLFHDFTSAISFMQKVSVYCNAINHHPNWTNVYNKIEVFLYSWDENSTLSQKDILLAKEMDKQLEIFGSKNVNKQDK